MGGKPVIVSTWRQKAETSISRGYEERFQLSQEEEGTNHLVIKDLNLSDSASYYCGALEFPTVEFGQGVFLHVKASPSNIRTVVRQPALERLRTGDSLNLSCTGSAGACAGEQNLYWFRRGAAQSAIMHHSTPECDYLPNDEPRETNCTLHLALKSVGSPDAGMYYCALVCRGEIVFGSGTRVDIADIAGR